MKRSLILFAALSLGGGCGGDSGKDSAEKPAKPEKPQVELRVAEPQPAQIVRAESLEVQGTVKPANSKVTIVAGSEDPKPVQVADNGRFVDTLVLGAKEGITNFGVKATHPGYRADTVSQSVERKLSEAELAEQKAQEEAEFRAGATAIEYDELLKDPYRYIGDPVVYYGQIFQIQEGYGRGFMLLSVTKEKYGFWEDEIYVSYKGHVESNEEDELTVYGTVAGAKSYRTQIGGRNTVPKVNAKYIDE